ncbi:MAG: hypothetical protein GY841_11770, partial [FCB group bacterium]|nr:hypothetical protein [FCB group bacterium]
MLRKITIIQCRPGRRLKTDEILHIFKQKPDFIILPEYQGVDPLWRETAANAELAKDFQLYCRNLAANLNAVLIAGTTIEEHSGRYYNTCRVFNRDVDLGHYHKVNPMPNERKHGISPGNSPCLFEI